MIWIKKRFHGVDYIPSFDTLEKLLMANPSQYDQFYMVSTKTNDAQTSDYFIGLPGPTFASAFSGFAIVDENDLPKMIDIFHIGDQTKPNFNTRFKFRGS